MAETNGLHRDDLMLGIQPRTTKPSLSHKEEQQLASQPFRLEPSLDAEDFLALKKKQRRRRCCAFFFVGSLVVVLIPVVTLALMVFRSKDPNIILNSTTLKSMGYSIDLVTLKPRLMNATVLSQMSIKNPNKGASFKFGDSTALIKYSGLTLGQAAIPAGEIEADKTAHMNVTVTIFIGDLMMNSNSALLAGGMSGNITLTSSARVPGRINVLHIIRRHVVVYSSCNITVNLATRLSQVDHCARHMKL